MPYYVYSTLLKNYRNTSAPYHFTNQYTKESQWIYDVDEFLELNISILSTYMHIMGFVNIIVHDETKDRLRKLKNNSRESYNDVITELLNEHDRNKEE